MKTEKYKDTEEPRTREVRLFVSSTFRDLEDVRNLLTINTFPRLRRYCQDLGVAFTEIDLRWGITDSESRAGFVLKACLEEIERCAEFPPFFVGILGNRYGWIPGQRDWENADFLELSLPGFRARHAGESITELEIQYGVLERPELLNSAVFYFTGIHEDEDPRQTELKKRLRESGARIQEGIREPTELANRIFSDLAEQIASRYPVDDVPDQNERLLTTQRIHSTSLAESYVASEAEFDKFKREVSAIGKYCLEGESGTGKSSLLAAYGHFLRRSTPDAHVFIHHIGIAESRTRFDWMVALLHWARSRSITDLPITASRTEVQANLPTLLAALEMTECTTIILDGLNQIDEESSLEEWFPFSYGKNLRWIVSTTDSGHATSFLGNQWKVLRIAPIDQPQAMQIVAKGLTRYRKQLPLDLLKRIAIHPMAIRPLFLKLLYEELRAYGRHETLIQHLNNLLTCNSTEEIFRELIKRITLNIGEYAPEILALICISRNGVSEPELRSALGLRPWDVHQAILIADPYLIRHNGLLLPFHEGLRNALLPEQNSDALRRRWCNFWKSSQDTYRRFHEYPHSLAFLDEWNALGNWIYEPETLIHAAEHQMIDVLAAWHARAFSATGFDPTPRAIGSRHMPLNALRALRELCYQTGSRDLEIYALDAQQYDPMLRKHQWLIENSILHFRRGDQEQALSFAYRAKDNAESNREALDSDMNLVQMLAFGESPSDAYRLTVQIRRDFGKLLAEDREAEAFLLQYNSIACHFLDLNIQSLVSSRRAAELYSALGRRYDQGICWVNAGDGAWGAGLYDEADRHFSLALEMADRYRLPHVKDIALICRANLLVSRGNLGQALEIYTEGILLADAIGQSWDSLYGKIYHELALGLLGRDANRLKNFADLATGSGYRYLADLARAHMIVLDNVAPSDLDLLNDSPFPGLRAYALAYKIINFGDSTKPLIDLIGVTEGIKGPFDYISNTLAGR
jgi:hypothetical protein